MLLEERDRGAVERGRRCEVRLGPSVLGFVRSHLLYVSNRKGAREKERNLARGPSPKV